MPDHLPVELDALILILVLILRLRLVATRRRPAQELRDDVAPPALTRRGANLIHQRRAVLRVVLARVPTPKERQ